MGGIDFDAVYKRISTITGYGAFGKNIPGKVQDIDEMQSTTVDNKNYQRREMPKKNYIHYANTNLLSVCMPLKDETSFEVTAEKRNLLEKKQQLKTFLKKVPSDFFEPNMIFIPIIQCQGKKNHLALVVIDKSKQSIDLYDPNPTRTVGMYLCCKPGYSTNHIYETISKSAADKLKNLNEYSWNVQYIGSQPCYSKDQEGKHIAAIAWLVLQGKSVTRKSVNEKIQMLAEKDKKQAKALEAAAKRSQVASRHIN